MSARRSVDGWLTTQDWAGVETCSAWRTGLSPAKAGSGSNGAATGRRDTGHLAFGGDGAAGGAAGEGKGSVARPTGPVTGLISQPAGLSVLPRHAAPSGGRRSRIGRAALICALVAMLLLIVMFRGERVEFYEGPYPPPYGARP